MLHETDVDRKEMVVMWVPGHVGIRETWIADRAANEAPAKEPTDNLIPSSDLRPLTAKHIHHVWYKE